MNVFITGIAGFMGSHLADYFLTKGCRVGGNDNLIGGLLDSVPDGASFSKVDCRDFESMKTLMRGYDVVIHTAATAHEGLSVFSPSYITKNIFEASVSVFSAAISADISHIVHCSSMARYGNVEPPFTEDMECKPTDPYGIAKLASEQILKNLCETHHVTYNIAVPHNIVGSRQRYDDPFRNVLSIMMHRALKQQPLVVYGDGTQIRCFSHISECIESIYLLATDTTIRNETFNIGPDHGELQIIELAHKINAITKNSAGIIFFPDRPREVRHAVCSSDKAREKLNYEPNKSVDEAIQETMDYILSRGLKDFDYSYPLEIVTAQTPKTWKAQLI